MIDTGIAKLNPDTSPPVFCSRLPKVASPSTSPLLLHTGLPLLPAGEDGGRCAILARFGCYEVRLTEFPPDSMPLLPLWVELYRESVLVLVDACGFSELEDAVEAVQELVEKAKRLHDGT